MQTELETAPELLDGPERNVLAQIRSHGWVRQNILADASGPGFSYTTGFWLSAGQPEFIMCGMRPDVVHEVFWNLFKEAKDGRACPLGVRTNFVFTNVDVVVMPVAKRHYAGHLGWNRWFYRGDDFPCLQIVWADRANILPWEPGFDATAVGLQPDLSEAGWPKG